MKLFHSTFWLIAELFCGERDLQAQQVFKGHTCSLCLRACVQARVHARSGKHSSAFLPRTDAVTQHQLRSRRVKTLRAAHSTAAPHPQLFISCPPWSDGPIVSKWLRVSVHVCVCSCTCALQTAGPETFPAVPNEISLTFRRRANNEEWWTKWDGAPTRQRLQEGGGSARRRAQTAGGTREGSQRERDDR